MADFGTFLTNTLKSGRDLVSLGLLGDLAKGKPAFTTLGNTVKGAVSGVTDVLAPPPNTFQAQGGTTGFQQGQIPINQTNFAPALQQSLNQAGGNQLNLADALARGQGQQQQGYDFATQAGQGQMSLADTLRAQAAGQGPSLAQLQLQQATDRNNAMAAGAVASQRGINPALAARMIGQQQANQNQLAAGQSAQTRMAEQFAAQQQLANVLAQAGQQGLGQAGAGQNLFGTAGQLTLGQQGQNSNTLQTLGGLNQSQNALNVEEALGRGKLNLSAAESDLASRDRAQEINAKVAAGNADQKAGVWKDIVKTGGNAIQMAAGFAAGGRVVPGRAKVAGDSPKNDTVPAMLSPGEVVLPRSVADDPDRAADFVAALSKKKKKKSGGSYADVLAKLAEIEGMLK